MAKNPADNAGTLFELLLIARKSKSKGTEEWARDLFRSRFHVDVRFLRSNTEPKAKKEQRRQLLRSPRKNLPRVLTRVKSRV